jgi:hypothetical protein
MGLFSKKINKKYQELNSPVKEKSILEEIVDAKDANSPLRAKEQES